MTSGGGSTESQYLSKSTNNQINIYFSKSRQPYLSKKYLILNLL